MNIESIRTYLRNYYVNYTANWRRKKIDQTDFTIISNNCWGGIIYESYNIEKKSPTVGLFFMADDYIKFIFNLSYYLNKELQFINSNSSKWKNELKSNKEFGYYPIGVIDDIEIHFLHYHTEKDADEKWSKRCKRINWEKLIIKFNDQNGCTEQHIMKFDSLKVANKICFTVNKDYSFLKSVVYLKAPRSHNYIRSSYEPFGKNKYCNVNKMICNL